MLEHSAFVDNRFDSNSCSAQAPSCLNQEICTEIIGVTLNFHWANYEQFQTLLVFQKEILASQFQRDRNYFSLPLFF